MSEEQESSPSGLQERPSDKRIKFKKKRSVISSSK